MRLLHHYVAAIPFTHCDERLRIEFLPRSQQEGNKSQQIRSFSSLTLPERTELLSQDIWTRVTNKLLSANLGSLSRLKWQEGLEALEYWTRQRTAPGLTWSWRLMDRLVDEEAYIAIHRPKDDLLLTQKHFGMLVGNWGRSASLLPARIVLDRLDHYHTILPHFQPNSRILGSLLTSALKKRDSNILDLVDTVLDRLEKNWTQERHPLSDPDIFAVDPAIRATTQIGHFQSPERADAIIERLKKLSTWSDIPPDFMNGLIMSHLSRSLQPGAALRVEEIFKDLQEPTIAGYIAVLQAWANSNDDGAADRCFAIWNHLKSQSSRIKLTARCYTPLINAFGRAQRPHEAEAILQDLLDEYERTQNPDLLPSTIPFNALIHAWSISGADDAALRAETLLQRMSDLSNKTNNPSLAPDRVSFTVVMSAWAHSKHKAGAQRAEQILQRMGELHQQGNSEMKPDSRAYAVAMEAWQNSGSIDAAARIKALFDQLVIQHESGDEDMAPSLRVYTVLLETLALHRVVPERMEAILKEMQSKAAAGNPSVQPTTPNYKCTIETWAYSGRKEAPMRMEALICDLHSTGRKADRQIYFTVLHAWAKSRLPEAASRADAIFELMKRKARSGEESVEPTIRIYNMLLKAWAHSRSQDAPLRVSAIMEEIGNRNNIGDERVLPTTITYNHAITCWAKFSPTHSEQLLGKMIAMYKAGNLDCKPDELSYNLVLSAWRKSNCEHRCKNAVTIFNQMNNGNDGIEVRPNKTSYFLMIYLCYSDRDRLEGAASMASGYLENLIQLYQVEKSFQPTYTCFFHSIVSLLQSSPPEVDEYTIALLETMEYMEKLRDTQGRNDAFHFSLLLSTLALSRVKNKLSRIHALLSHAKCVGVNKITAKALHDVLKACCITSEDDLMTDDNKILLINDILARHGILRHSTFTLAFKALATMHGHEEDVRLLYCLCVNHRLQDSTEVEMAYHEALERNQTKFIEVAVPP